MGLCSADSLPRVDIDAYVAAQGNALPLADDTSELPTADELGAELERFLAEENDRRGRDG